MGHKVRFKEIEKVWDWTNLHHARAAFIGDNTDSNKRACLEALAREKMKDDPHSVYWITPFPVQTEGKTIEFFDLAVFEALPYSSEEATVGSEDFPKRRMDFLQKYLDLVAAKKGEERTDIIPLCSYLPNKEGAFLGYVRALETMQDEHKKNYLHDEFSKLTHIPWVYQEGKGYHYVYENTPSDAETLLSFLVGCWAFWSYTALLHEPKDLLLIIEVPSALAQIETNPEFKQTIQEVLYYLSILSNDITCTSIVSTETFFPIPELNIRHHFYWNYNSKDFDWRLEDNRGYFPDSLIKSWSAGEKDKALWKDLLECDSHILSFAAEGDVTSADSQHFNENYTSSAVEIQERI
ncbi:hypothetical protein [Peribacillus asahii]|uniref:hypothetical protein n=1 Tax=Peribacillus asahii TaxID=228899 RepID=UPI00207A0DD7|nr:hypothetical protein [Peribacillus asahii]USK62319.1 hypothetical protein LIT37_24405 [Peribacillus asahii]